MWKAVNRPAIVDMCQTAPPSSRDLVGRMSIFGGKAGVYLDGCDLPACL